MSGHTKPQNKFAFPLLHKNFGDSKILKYLGSYQILKESLEK